MGRSAGWMGLLLLVAAGCDDTARDDVTGGNDGTETEDGDRGITPPSGEDNADGHSSGALLNGTVVCFYTEEDSVTPAATIEHRLEVTEGVESLHARLTLDSRFVDNTYGENAIGWDGAQGGKKPKAREFDQLVGSDHALMRMLDANGDTSLEFKLDYISEDSSSPSGYADLGVLDGDGEMLQGDASAVVSTSTSMSRNLNEHGYTAYLESSPATDAMYTPNTAAPNWEYPVVYEVWVDLAAFPAGFGDAHVDFIHASPSKTGNNTVTVIRERCPPDTVCPPDGCGESPPPPPPPGGCQQDSDCEEDELCFGGECKDKAILI